jgi:hypothetical protein
MFTVAQNVATQFVRTVHQAQVDVRVRLFMTGENLGRLGTPTTHARNVA